MGACTSSSTDRFEGTGLYYDITPVTEIFAPGRQPIVNQNPRAFGDDEPIKQRMGQQQINQLQALQQTDYDLKTSLRIEVKSHAIGPQNKNNNNSQKTALLVSIKTKELVMEDQFGSLKSRPGIDLICVIDHSGSMAGQKIKLVKRTLKHMLEFLKDDDRLCLIQFDCKCYRITRLMRVSQQNIPKFRIAIQSIQARGGTNIENGMHMAFSIIKHRVFMNDVTAIFLLSDGVDEGAEERVLDSLRSCKITDPFTIKSFGFGVDVCPKIMNEIAHMKEGQFFFVPDLTKIDECFVEALGGLVSVVANNLKLSVKCTSQEATKISKAYGDKWQYDSWNKVHTLYQPHLLSGIQKDFIFEVPESYCLGLFRGGTCKWEGENILQQRTRDKIPDQGNVAKNEVMSNYMRVKGAECLQGALQHAENGNFRNGEALIDDAMRQMQSEMKNNPQDNQMEMVNNDLLLAKQCIQQPSTFNTDGRHHLMQLHVVHMYQKSRGVQIQAQDGAQGNNNNQIDCAYQNNIQRAFKDKTRQMKQDGTYEQMDK